ncbi:MAG TPA: TolC family protein, partial [Methylomirabilota bacterium]|nr:TolC family protein [Methylomirabilota bacterium]
VGRVLTLDECIAIALEAQPSIQATLYDYAAARARVREAFSPLLPQLSGTATAVRSNSTVLTTASATGRTVAVVASRQPADTFLAQVQLSQLLFDFGKTLAATQVARKLAEVSAEGVELQRQLIALTVKEAYTNILLAQRLIRVQEQALERADLNLSSAKGFYDVGTQPLSTVVRAEVDVANAKVDLINARNALRTARVALNTAMAVEASTPTEIRDNLAYEPITLDRAALRAEALRQSPEYRQAKLQSSAAEANVQVASRNFLPNISGTGSYGGTQPDLNPTWSLGLAFTWNIFDGGHLIAAYQEAKANLGAAGARVKAAELTLIQSLEQAEIAVEAAQERIQAALVLINSAQENFRLAQGRFDVGVGTILELTDAQLALTQAQNTEAQALADYRIALAQLDRAAGRR